MAKKYLIKFLLATVLSLSLSVSYTFGQTVMLVTDHCILQVISFAVEGIFEVPEESDNPCGPGRRWDPDIKCCVAY
jgi:hypothetical protein